MSNAPIEIIWRNRRVFIPLQQVQQVIDCIDSNFTNNELRSMLDLFVSDFDIEESRKAREQEKLMNDKIEKDIE